MMKIKVFLVDSDYCCRLFSCDGMEIADLGESHYEIRFLFDNDNPLVFRLSDRFFMSDFLHGVAVTGFADFCSYILWQEIPF